MRKNGAPKIFMFLGHPTVDPHSFFADLNPAVYLNADQDPAAYLMRILIRIQP